MAYRCLRKGQDILVFDRAGNPAFKQKGHPRFVTDYATNTRVELPPDSELTCVDYDAKPSICVQFAPQECNAFSDFCQSYNYRGQRRCRRRGTTMKSLNALEACYQERDDLLRELADVRAQQAQGVDPENLMELNPVELANLRALNETLAQKVAQYEEELARNEEEKRTLLQNLAARPDEAAAQARVMPDENRELLLANIDAEKEQLQAALVQANERHQQTLGELQTTRRDLEEFRTKSAEEMDNMVTFMAKLVNEMHKFQKEANDLKISLNELKREHEQLINVARQLEQQLAAKTQEWSETRNALEASRKQEQQLQDRIVAMERDRDNTNRKYEVRIAALNQQLLEPKYLPPVSENETYAQKLQRANVAYVDLKQKYDTLLAAQRSDDSTFTAEIQTLQDKLRASKAQTAALERELAEVREKCRAAAAEHNLDMDEIRNDIANTRAALQKAQNDLVQQQAVAQQYEQSFAQVLSQARANMTPDEVDKFLAAVLPEELRPAVTAAANATIQRAAGPLNRRQQQRKMYQDVQYVVKLLAEASRIIQAAHPPVGPRRRRPSARKQRKL